LKATYFNMYWAAKMRKMASQREAGSLATRPHMGACKEIRKWNPVFETFVVIPLI
jgi:hypothetical protein